MTTLLLALTLAATPPISERPTAEQTNLKGGDAQTALQLMNVWGEQPESVQEIYSAAHSILDRSKDASFADLADDEPFQALCKKHNITHLGGPMLGCVTPESVKVWVRTCRSAEVTVRVTINGVEATFGPACSTRESDLVAIVPVAGLEPGRTYPYRVLINGQPIDIPEHAAIRTPPAEGSEQLVRITFGTCFHRWGLGNVWQTDQILGRGPSAMLLGGDIAVQDRNNHLGMHRADYLLRDCHPAWQDLAAAVPIYATWDDHDYFDNDKAGIPKGYTGADKEGVHGVFRTAWNNPSCGFEDDRRGVFFRTRIGPCDIIMLDHRYFRSGEHGSFLGEEQMQWFESQLLACKGPFIILSCGAMWSDYVSAGKDSWGRWDPEGRERIFRFIEAHKIPGVLLISGDRHGARGFRIPRPSGHSFYEFEAGSLGGRKGPPVSKPEWKDVQLYGIADRYAFGEFTFNPAPEDPEVTFRLIADDGEVIHQETLTRGQLTPK